MVTRLIKTVKMQMVEERYGGKDIRVVLQDAYVEHKTGVAVAAALGISRMTLGEWHRILGIKAKTIKMWRSYTHDDAHR